MSHNTATTSLRAFFGARLPSRIGSPIARWEKNRQERIRKQGLSALRLRLGALWRTQPIRPDFGWKYGQCIDRYYIETFLNRYAADVCGRVLEIQDDYYTKRFGGNRVTHSDVLHFTPGNSAATIVGDLSKAENIASNTFDCIILTQTLQFIYDMRSTVHTLYRIVKPGGVVLATFPGISQVSRYDMDNWGEYWRFTSLSARNLFCESFPKDRVTVEAYGNVLTTIAFLHGLVTRELRTDELDLRDRNYELLISARAMKPYNQPEPEHDYGLRSPAKIAPRL